jgi:hypothetical protein
MKKKCATCGQMNFNLNVCQNCKSDLSKLPDLEKQGSEEKGQPGNEVPETKVDPQTQPRLVKRQFLPPDDQLKKSKLKEVQQPKYDLGSGSPAPQIDESGWKMVEIPFMGDNGLNIVTPDNLTGVYFQKGHFDVRFQQRNDVTIDIDTEIEQKDQMFSMLTIKTPNINELTDSAKDIFLIPSLNLQHSENNPYFIPITSIGDDAKIDFGNLIIASTGLEVEGKTIKNVMPLISAVPLKEYLEGKSCFISNKVAVNVDTIKETLTDDSLIKHELYTKEEEFRWEYPISIKAEVENPIMSFMKTISAYEGRNADIFNKFDVKDELSNKKLKEILSAKYFGGKEQDFIGIYPSILANTALATFRIHLTNSTLQQVFTSNIRNLEVKVKFPDKFADLFLPSNLRVIGPKDLEAFFDNESDMLVWTEYPVIKPGESVVFEFQCIWKVIQAMDRIDIEIRGEYIDSPLVLDSFVYTTPTGFPVMGEGQNAIWNPGIVDTGIGIFIAGAGFSKEFSEKTCLQNLSRKLDSVPSFFEQVQINMDKIKAEYEEVLSIIKENKEFVKGIKEMI